MNQKIKIFFNHLVIFLLLIYTSDSLSEEVLNVNKISIDSVDPISFEDVKTGCFQTIYFIQRNRSVWEWSDERVIDMLKTHLEWYLLWFNTEESIQLLSLYESVEWDVDKMMEIHSLPQYKPIFHM
jgi:hypothetical protein